MILSARYVKCSQTDRSLLCDHCVWPIFGEHIRLYIKDSAFEKPHTSRFHVDCIAENMDISQEPKIKDALEKVRKD